MTPAIRKKRGMEKCSTSAIKKALQIQSTETFTSQPSEWSSGEWSTKNERWKGLRDLCTLWLLGGEKTVTASSEKRMVVRVNLRIELPCDLGGPLMRLSPEQTRMNKGTGRPSCTAGTFTTAKTWKTPKCPSAGKCARNKWSVDTMEYWPC